MNDRSSLFSQKYFMEGRASGLSNYENYRWLPEITLPCVHRMMEYVGARHGELILDVGAGPGMYVKACRMLGFEAFGFDISQWAVQNCHPDVIRYMSTDWPKFFPDWAYAKDSFEHIPELQLVQTCERLCRQVSKGLLIIVPLTETRDGPYVRKEDEMDVTHVIRWPMQDWMGFLETHFPKFTLSASYHVPGIKPASEQVRHSTGFFKLTK